MKTAVGIVAMVALLALAVPTTWSQQGIDPSDRIGKVSFPISCKPANPPAAVRMHWKMYPETKPQIADEARALRESIHVFNARFETQRVDNRDDKRFGASSAAQWSRLKAIYKEQGLIQGNVEASEVFTNALVDEINRFDQPAVIRQAREYR